MRERTMKRGFFIAMSHRLVATARARMRVRPFSRTGHVGQTRHTGHHTGHHARALRHVAAVLFLLGASAALAQYPARAVRLLVPNPPGGATDTVARVVGPKLGELLGQPIVVENRPGSNGNLSSELTAKAAPDGYTLLLAPDSQIVINPHLYAKMSVDTLRDLAPVATLVSTQMILCVIPSLPVRTVQEFIDYARQARPPLAYASIGNGSQHHLVMEMLKVRAGVELLHVPFKGGGPATTALLAGDVPAMFGGNSVAGHIRSGRLKPLALAATQRSPAYPDLPTLAELYPGLEVNTWLALFAPAGVPSPVLTRLRTEVQRTLGDAETQEKLRKVGGLDLLITGPEEFSALIRADHARYGQVVKSVGATVD
jgi:tripartite-type tricarboxylate transporter receptor subunit TctC